jgi:SAM-dependent methyltransferase
MIDIRSNRRLYAGYLSGRGIEIGALNAPLAVDPDVAKVTHADRLTTDELRQAFPDLDDIVDVGLVSRAEDLSAIRDGSLDFIIANHVVEHLSNPLGALEVWRTKLRDGGILYMAFPGAAFCPDRTRPVTSTAHLLEDYHGRVSQTMDEHLLSFTLAWNPGFFPDPEALGRLLESMRAQGLLDLDVQLEGTLGVNRDAVDLLLRDHRGDNIHQHVFTFDSMKSVLATAREELGLQFRLVDLSLTKGCLSEYVFVLEATAFDTEEEGFFSPRAEAAERIERFYESWYGEVSRLLGQPSVST